MTEAFKKISDGKMFEGMSEGEKLSCLETCIAQYIRKKCENCTDKDDVCVDREVSELIVLRDRFTELEDSEYQKIYDFAKNMDKHVATPNETNNLRRIMNLLIFDSAVGKTLKL